MFLIMLVAGLGSCLVLSGVLYAVFGDFLPSFPEAFLGQMTLARETRPPMPREIQSAEFVLGQVSSWQVERAEYIEVGEEVYFWGPHYVGFARTPLSAREVQAAQEIFHAARLFQSTAVGPEYRCVVFPRTGKPRLEECAEGAELMDQYAEIDGRSQLEQADGVFVANLRGGKVIEVRVHRYGGRIAFRVEESAGPWYLMGVSGDARLFDSLHERVQVQPVPQLWPRMTAEAANARARRILGPGYNRALEAVRQSPEVLAAFGEPLSLRPAHGINIYASWMDSTSVTLTLTASGPRGEGAVLVRGYDTFQIEIVSDGKLLTLLSNPKSLIIHK